jgi:hypothetical protein
MTYRQEMPYAVRAGRSKTDLCRHMARCDAVEYACDKSNRMPGIRYYVVYNPRNRITDFEMYFLDGIATDCL